MLSLPEQLDLVMREQRFEDAKRLKADIIAQHDLEQQLALAVKDERFDDCIRFRDALAQAKDGQGKMKMPNWMHPQSKMEGSKRSARNEQATEVQRN